MVMLIFYLHDSRLHDNRSKEKYKKCVHMLHTAIRSYYQYIVAWYDHVPI